MPLSPFVVFDGPRLLTAGSRLECALAFRRARDAGTAGPLLIFEAESGAGVDFDIQGSEAEIAERLAEPAASRGRGRPKLGVVPREVTLLPRHWEWLADQPGGASVALRKLVDEAWRADGGATEERRTKADAEVTERVLSYRARLLANVARRMPNLGDLQRVVSIASLDVDGRSSPAAAQPHRGPSHER